MKIQLVIDIEYDETLNPTLKNAEYTLNYAAEHLASSGFLTDEDATLSVKEWSAKVVEMWQKNYLIKKSVEIINNNPKNFKILLSLLNHQKKFIKVS